MFPDPHNLVRMPPWMKRHQQHLVAVHRPRNQRMLGEPAPQFAGKLIHKLHRLSPRRAVSLQSLGQVSAIGPRLSLAKRSSGVPSTTYHTGQ
jgi:hypothetical protein